ncbi:hypothetical protein HPG69_002998, partial [Diceros bicornis minor]
GEISRLPLALGLDVNIYYVCLFSPRRWLRSRIPRAPFPLLTVPSARPLRPPAEPARQSPVAELLRRLLIRLPPAPKLAAALRARPSSGVLEPAAANLFGILYAFSSSPWASIASRQPPRQQRPRQPGGGSQGLNRSANLPGPFSPPAESPFFPIASLASPLPTLAWPRSCDGLRNFSKQGYPIFNPENTKSKETDCQEKGGKKLSDEEGEGTWAKWSQHHPAWPGKSKQACSIWGPHGGRSLQAPRLG